MTTKRLLGISNPSLSLYSNRRRRVYKQIDLQLHLYPHLHLQLQSPISNLNQTNPSYPNQPIHIQNDSIPSENSGLRPRHPRQPCLPPRPNHEIHRQDHHRHRLEHWHRSRGRSVLCSPRCRQGHSSRMFFSSPPLPSLRFIPAKSLIIPFHFRSAQSLKV